ncbi:hypothetical protein KEGY108214_17460 [Kerstersia gyiorum]
MPDDAAGQLGMGRRVDDIRAAAQDGHRGRGERGRAVQCASMRGSIYAACQPADDHPAGAGERACEGIGVLFACRGGVASADNGDGGSRQHLRVAFKVEQQRWVGQLAQGVGVAGVMQRQGMALCAAAQPVRRLCQAGRQFGAGRTRQLHGQGSRQTGSQYGSVLLVDGRWRGEALQQRQCGTQGQARFEREAQPGRQDWVRVSRQADKRADKCACRRADRCAGMRVGMWDGGRAGSTHGWQSGTLPGQSGVKVCSIEHTFTHSSAWLFPVPAGR